MSKNLDIEFDTSDWDTKVSAIKGNIKKIARRMMNKVFYEIKKQGQKNVKGAILKRDTGFLAKCFKYETWSDYRGNIKNTAFYSSMLENGAVINAKEDKYLTMVINGEWKKVKQVVLPARPFLLPAFKDMFETGKAENLMNQKFQEEIDKIENSK